MLPLIKLLKQKCNRWFENIYKNRDNYFQNLVNNETDTLNMLHDSLQFSCCLTQIRNTTIKLDIDYENFGYSFMSSDQILQGITKILG